MFSLLFFDNHSLGWNGGYPFYVIFAHACGFNTPVMETRLLQSRKHVKDSNAWYAILPWYPLTRTVKDDNSLKRIADTLSRAYSTRISPANHNLFTWIDYNNHLEERCVLTRQGLEHYFGFRLGFDKVQ